MSALPTDQPLRLMTVHAHPDDEASKGAATCARYVAEGVEVMVVTCTGGEAGSILNPAMDTPEVNADMPGTRRAEMAHFSLETLGLERNPNSTETWTEFETGNVTLALVTPEDFGMEFAPLPFGSIVLRVPDVEATKERLGDLGVEFEGETWDSGVCNGASFFDPDGNGLAVHRRYAPYLDGTTA